MILHVLLLGLSSRFYPKLPSGRIVKQEKQPNKPVHYLSCFWFDNLITATEKKVGTNMGLKRDFIAARYLGMLILWRMLK